MSEPYYIKQPRGPRLPILVSCPHSGTEIPPDIAATMDESLAKAVPDTDWFVHELYSFAPALGITVMHARYSRYVVDLNRDPAGQQLYSDGRVETGLVPTQSFAQEPIYHGTGTLPTAAEIERRRQLYFVPYHKRVRATLDELQRAFPHVLLFDAHSIKRRVPSIRPDPFPDLILGDQKGATAAASIISAALAALQYDGSFNISHNEPFMGGYITRHFGRPAAGQHALQLEMAQGVYMNEAEGVRDPDKARQVSRMLELLLARLAEALAVLA